MGLSVFILAFLIFLIVRTVSYSGVIFLANPPESTDHLSVMVCVAIAIAVIPLIGEIVTLESVRTLLQKK